MKTDKNKVINFKSYLRDFLLFIDKYLKNYIKIFLVISLLVVAISLPNIISTAKSNDCEGTCIDKLTFIKLFWSNIEIILVAVVIGVVPYIYAPILGFICYILSQVYRVAFIIKGFGYAKGILIALIPFCLNIINICIVTAAGIYICKTVTVGYKISSITNMNFLNFRIKVYEVFKKEEKIKVLEEKKNKKLDKLNNKKEKIKYIQILNIIFVTVIIQLVTTLIQLITL